MITSPRVSMIALAAAALAGCGGGSFDEGAGASMQSKQAAGTVMSAPTIQGDVTTQAAQIVELSTSPRAMQSIAFQGNTAYVSLFNTAKEDTTVLKANLPLAKASWKPADLGKCVLPAYKEDQPYSRAPSLKSVNGKLWLFQPWMQTKDIEKEHSLCELDEQTSSFMPKDAGLVVCNEVIGCTTLAPSDIKSVRNRLLINAGGADNVQVSETGGAKWRVLSGHFDSMACYDAKFEIVGDRLLVGGECPLDSAYLRSYQLTPYTLERKSTEALPIKLPNLQNRNIQFIERIAGTNRVFVGVEGGLLRSEDAGRSFQFVIHHPIGEEDVHPVSVSAVEPGSYPYIWKMVSPANQPNTIVVAGFDKPKLRPYLAWSADGGTTWTDLSSKLPGYAAAAGGQVTDLVISPQGQVLITVNEEMDGKGRLMQVTLGK